MFVYNQISGVDSRFDSNRLFHGRQMGGKRVKKRVAFFIPENPPKKAKKSKSAEKVKNSWKNQFRKSPFCAGLQEGRHQVHALLFGGAIAMHIALHGKRDVGMPDDLRQGADILTALYPKRGERVTRAIETLEKLGYTLAVQEDGNISVRGRPSSQAEAALSVLRADKATAALCLRQMEDFKRVKHAFCVAFDFFQAHFPPTTDAAYWMRTSVDLSAACAAVESDPLGAYRANRKPWLVCMPLDGFLALLKET